MCITVCTFSSSLFQANLCPETPEEAKSLIPSLEGSRFDEEELGSLLEDIQVKEKG